MVLIIEHLSKRLRPGLCGQEKSQCRPDGFLEQSDGGVRKKDPGSSQWCPVVETGQWAQTETY